jgi:hypothetical protein
MRETSVRICTRSLASRFDSGSSIRNTLGSRTIARPMATRWRWPPERLAGLRSRWLGEVERPRGLLDLAVDLALVDLGELEREAHVLAHGHVRVQRVVLEDHRDVAIARGALVDPLAADGQLALGDVLEARDHPQRGRLPAARRPDEDHELPVLDVEVELLDGLGAVGVALGDVAKLDVGHIGPAPF